MSGNESFPSCVVIPAKAGIQWILRSSRRMTVLLFVLLSFHASVFAASVSKQDPKVPDSETKQVPPVTTVVSANRREIPIEKSTRAVTVITREEIEKSGKVFLLDLLRGVPGVMVTQSGTFGRESNIFIRGLNKESTLVMIDGVQVNNANQEIAAVHHLTTANIERIEIIRGTQSVLYGADAVGGVINIVTKPDARKGIHAGGRFEYGTYESFYEEGNASASTEKLSLSAAGGRLDTKGLSENDEYENTTARVHGKLQVTDNSDLDMAFHHYNSITGIEGGAFNTDPNDNSRSNQQVVNTKYAISLADWWQQHVRYSLFHDSSLTVQPRDLPGSGADEFVLFKINSNRHTFEYQSDFYIQDFDVLTVGYEFEHSTVNSKGGGAYSQLTRNHGFFAQNELTLWKIWTIATGIRMDEHELYGFEASPLISSGLWIAKTATKLKGSFGRGFRAPTFNQLFSQSVSGGKVFGNPNVLPETSWNWDAGFEQFYWNKRGSLSAMYFDNRVKNLILNTFPTSNVGRVRGQGVELEHRIEILEGLYFNTSYTYTHSINRETKKRLARIPRHMGKFGLSYDYKRLHCSGNWLWVGSRDDGTTRLDEYTRLDLALFYDLTKFAQVYARIDNATNDEYYEARGFDMPHVGFYTGIKGQF